MTVKLYDIFDIAKEHGISLIAGKKGLQNDVRWFRVMENTDIIEYMEKEMLLFTTGAAITDEKELIKLVKMQHQKKSSGTVLHVGMNIKQVPDELISYCNHHDYPLFSIPWENNLPLIMKDLSMFFLDYERMDRALEQALMNVISVPDREEDYLPVFIKHGFLEDATYCTVLVEFCGLCSQVEGKRIEQIKKRIKMVLIAMGTNSFVTEGDHSFIILFSKYSMDIINQIASRIEKVLASIECDYLIGIGNNVGGLTKISESYLQARWCVKVSSQKDITNCIVNFEDIGIYKLLSLIGDQERLKEFYTETIGALEDYDRLKDTRFKEVLKLYISNNRSEKKVAELMYLHRNTINYQLAKIEKIIDCDLSQVDVFVKIYLAFCIENIIM
ncbi:hypothetical protein SANA_07100 [Gottschalkiaceae bacterium SANA]|nr:hypothetical protein SANA_07100 [Gottschalkiaceae bacterium SANA]